MAVDYKKQIGFGGTFYIEPKPMEPTKHQYDSDAAACLNFLRTYDLLPHFKLNLETNHATLAGHEMMHELEVAIGAGALGSIDANTGDPQLGLGHRPVPDERLPDDPVHALHPGHGGVHHRRRQLRRQGAPRELRADRPVLCPHRRHGRLRTRAEDRRTRSRATAAWPRSSRSATGAGTASSAGGSSRARSASPTSRPTSCPRARRRRTRSGRQEMLENLINDFI